MTLTNTKDGIRMRSKMLPCAAAVCYLDNSRVLQSHRGHGHVALVKQRRPEWPL